MDMGIIKNYIRINIWDWLLCSVIAAGLTVNICSGWEMTDSLSYNLPGVIAVSALMQIVCFAAIYNRKTTIGLTGAGLIYVIAVVVYAKNTGVLAQDTEHSQLIFTIVAVFANILVCLISRSRIGIAVLLALGNLIIATAAFLQFPVINSAYYLFLFGTIVLLLYKVYFVTALAAVTGKVQLERYLGQIVCIALTGIILAVGVYTYIIQPLDPPTNDLKLIERLEKSQIIQRTGIASVVTLPDYELLSQMEADNSKTTNNTEEEQDDDSMSQNSDKADQTVDEGTIKDRLEDAYAIRYSFKTYTWILILIVILLLLASPFIIKEVLRKRWYQSVMALSPDGQVVNLYNGMLNTFGRVDMKKAASETPTEYCRRLKNAMEPYDEGHASFEKLTGVYMASYFGLSTASQEDIKEMESYSRDLRGRIRKEIGILRFALKYFRI